ncbi:MAG: PIN domain-containing protein [Bifidobacteriaceae bacterium]|jgi:predicted nucleic acid-binding protein|nr:PIN domain-containing protein [Bifidobacteriaceae bacterium]
MIVLDASVIIALLDPENIHHQAVRPVYASDERLAVSTLTLAEVMVYPLPEPRNWEAFITDFEIAVIPLLDGDAGGLAQVRRETRLRMPDSVVLYTAMKLGADIATTDRHLARAASGAGLHVLPGGFTGINMPVIGG